MTMLGALVLRWRVADTYAGGYYYHCRSQQGQRVSKFTNLAGSRRFAEQAATSNT